MRAGGAPAPSQPFRLTVPGPSGGFVLEADVSPGDLAGARARWRAMTRAAVLGVLAVALLLCAGPLMDRRRQTRDLGRFLGISAVLIVLVIVARAILFVALRPLAQDASLASFELLLTTLAMAAVVWLVLDLIERRRLARPRAPLLRPTPSARLTIAAAFFLAGDRKRAVGSNYQSGFW